MTIVRLAGVEWEVTPARVHPANVCWLTARRFGAILIYERVDGLWGCSHSWVVPYDPTKADRVLRETLAGLVTV